MDFSFYTQCMVQKKTQYLPDKGRIPTFIVFVFINVSSLNRILNFVKALNGRI